LLGPVLYLGILFRPDLSGVVHRPDLRPRILHGPDLSVLLHRPDICPGIMQGPDVPVRLRGRSLYSGNLHDLCSGILYGLYGPHLCPCSFLGYPSLELLEQGLVGWLTVFGLTLIGSFKSGSNFVARGRFPCSRRQSVSAFR
jgi:hypothetical protein